MADDMNSSSKNSTVEDSSVKKHHKPDTLSYNRPKYRDARWERAVKVCTFVFSGFGGDIVVLKTFIRFMKG